MPSDSRLLALDLSSGGVTAALMGSDLRQISTGEIPWTLVPDREGAATLSAAGVIDAVAVAIRSCLETSAARPEALVLSSMMHTLVLTTMDGQPLSPIYTWNDRRELPFSRGTPDRLGPYRERTGCHFHPSYPAFKLAWLRQSGSRVLDGEFRLASLRSWVQGFLTGYWLEDVSTASASGLLDLRTGEWDATTLDLLELDANVLPERIESHRIAGHLTRSGAARIGLRAGVPVVAGGGDGFLATLGSGCDAETQAAATLGTTASVRRFIDSPARELDPRTFCYRYGDARYLSGCAGNNGGNVLEWGCRALGPIDESPGNDPVPIFFPFLNGERAPFWNAALEPRWIGANGTSMRGLRASIPECLAFQLAAYLELTAGSNAALPEALVLSGNGFRAAPIAGLLADLVPLPVLLPGEPGMATIRGAARCGFEAMDVDTRNAMGRLRADAKVIAPSARSGLAARYARFRNVYLGESQNSMP